MGSSTDEIRADISTSSTTDSSTEDKNDTPSTSDCLMTQNNGIPLIQKWIGKPLKMELQNGGVVMGVFHCIENPRTIILTNCPNDRKNVKEEESDDEKAGDTSTSACSTTERNDALPSIKHWLGSDKTELIVVRKNGSVDRETLVCSDDVEERDKSGSNSDIAIDKAYAVSSSRLDESGSASLVPSVSPGKREQPGRLKEKYSIVKTDTKGDTKFYTGKSKSDGEIYFIKMIKIKGDNKEDLKKAAQEAIHTASLSHSNLARYFTYWIESGPEDVPKPAEENPTRCSSTEDLTVSSGNLAASADDVLSEIGSEKRLYLVLKYYGKTNLGHLWEDNEVPWELCCQVAAEISSALVYLHKMNLRHNDVHDGNIVLEKVQDKQRAILIDFGDMSIPGDTEENDQERFVTLIKKLFRRRTHREMETTMVTLNGEDVPLSDLLSVSDPRLKAMELPAIEIIFGKIYNSCRVCAEFRTQLNRQQIQIDDLRRSRLNQQRATLIAVLLLNQQQIQIDDLRRSRLNQQRATLIAVLQLNQQQIQIDNLTAQVASQNSRIDNLTEQVAILARLNKKRSIKRQLTRRSRR